MNMENGSTQSPGRSQMELGDYFAILKRRKWALLIPFTLIMIGALLLAFMLPPVYQSEATILIERQEIPSDLVETTVTGYVQERIEALNKRLLTHENLWDIIKQEDLYPQERATMGRHDLVVQMRDSINVEMVDVKTSEPGKGSQGVATIAFTVSYESPDPETAQHVTGKLASLYVAANERTRTEQAFQVSGFLQQEATRLNKKITTLEGKLAQFKQKEQKQLPELKDLNQQLYEKTGSDIERTREEIQRLNDKINSLQAELDITDPRKPVVNEEGRTVLTGSERLSSLTAKYVRLSARYSPQHPDLVRLRREIKALSGQYNNDRLGQLVDKLTALREQLSTARQKYSEQHPDVQRLERTITSVKDSLRSAQIEDDSGSSAPQAAPDNPRYISLQTQLDAAQGNLKSEKAKLDQLKDKQNKYQERLFQTPMVERDYKLLTRNYQSAKDKYNEIKNKQLQASLAQQLEASSQGQRFNIVQPAFLPGTPDRPNRLGVGLLGFLLACSIGIGTVTAREYTDRTIYSTKDLTSMLRAPPLVTIPYIPDSVAPAPKRWRAAAGVMAGLVVLSLCYLVINHYWLSSGQLITQALR